MAEVVGVVSAAVTFADIGVKILGKSFELALRMEDAPKELQDIKITHELLVKLFRRVSVTASSDQRNDTLFNELLTQVNDQVNLLEQHISGLLPLVSDTKIQSVKKSLKHILKTDKLRTIKTNLESVKDNLLIYLSNHESSTIRKITRDFQDNLQLLNVSTTNIEDIVIQLEAQSGTVSSKVDALASHSTTIEHQVRTLTDGMADLATMNDIKTISQLSINPLYEGLNDIKRSIEMLSTNIARQNSENQACIAAGRLLAKPQNLQNMLQSYEFRTMDSWESCNISSGIIIPNSNRQKRSKWKYAQKFLGRCIEISFTLTNGAGGFSISPSISFQNVIPDDEGIFGILDRMVYLGIRMSCERSSSNLDLFYEEFSNIPKEITRALSMRKARLNDVDLDGNNILHKAVKVSQTILTRPRDLLHDRLFDQILTILVGITKAVQNQSEDMTHAVNTSHQRPIDTLMFYTRGCRSWTKPLMILCEKYLAACNNILTISRGSKFHTWSILVAFDIILYLAVKNMDCLRQYLECGPLHIAVLDRSIKYTNLILETHPDSIHEKNAVGQTPLHLSVLWPEGLEVLLQQDGIDIDVLDRDDYTPLAYALLSSNSLSVRLLLEQGCSDFITYGGLKIDALEFFCVYIDLYADKSDMNIRMENIEALWETEISICLLLINNLTRQRTRLRLLAEKHLSNSKWQFLRLDEVSIPDGKHARQVVDAIVESQKGQVNTRGKGYLEGRFWPNQNCRRFTALSRIHGCDDYSTFYLLRSKALFQAGFRDINSVDTSGLTPLIFWICQGWSCICMVDWLLENKADPLVPDIYGRTVPHYLMGAVLDCGGSIKTDIKSYIIRFKPMLEANFIEAHDLCECACSNTGCTPCSTYFRHDKSLPVCVNHVCEKIIHSYKRKSDPRLCRDCIFLSLNLSQSNKQNVTKIYCRLKAFQAFEITHTCCLRDHGYSPLESLPEADRRPLRSFNLLFSLPAEDEIFFSRDEIYQIHSEEEYLIDELEDLMVTFDPLFLDYISQDGNNEYSFYEDIWKHEVKKRSDKLNLPISKEDELKLRQIGVDLSQEKIMSFDKE